MDAWSPSVLLRNVCMQPLADSGGVHRHVRGVAAGDRAHVRVVRAQPVLQAQHPLHHRHAGARAAHDLRLHELQGKQTSASIHALKMAFIHH